MTLNNGVNSCNTGYDGPEKEPEYVSINLVVTNDNNNGNEDQSQSQSSSNNNNNALSQSQETKIYICNDEGCKIQ